MGAMCEKSNTTDDHDRVKEDKTVKDPKDKAKKTREANVFKHRRGEAMEMDENGKYHKVSYKPIEAQIKKEEEEAMPAHSMATHALLLQEDMPKKEHVIEIKKPKEV